MQEQLSGMQRQLCFLLMSAGKYAKYVIVGVGQLTKVERVY